MRIPIGKMVNPDVDVNMAELKPLDRIIAAIVNAYHGTSFYKRRYAETEEKRQEQWRKVRESLIDNLLMVITPQLEENIFLKDLDDTCTAILVEVPSRFHSCLMDVVSAHEFDAYEITVIPPNKLLSKFAKPPFLLYICNRGG